MELRDRVAVVTGGASGIGRALCLRFAREGARGVVVADLDADGARRVAEEIGGLAVAADVGVEAQVQALVAEATRRFGRIDLFCSNAGVGRGIGFGDGVGGPFAPDADWASCWQVNVMAHVYAARAVLPGMLERGEGTLLQTASAAGLITDLAGCAYSTTKHAAVAFAEWLAIAYGDRGIRIACLCPQGVRTPMLRGAAAAFGGAPHLERDAIEPEAVADAVVAGLADGRFLILPHPEVQRFAERRAADNDAWLAGMRRLRARLYGASGPPSRRP
jgi:NAD(P)-dependent dehydrogenase (short-subunit alcohol dehydrogenase family)